MSARLDFKHPCPCGCGTNVPDHQVCCQDSWYLLPTQLRLEIANGDKATKLTARAQGEQWLREHVVAGVPIGGGQDG